MNDIRAFINGRREKVRSVERPIDQAESINFRKGNQLCIDRNEDADIVQFVSASGQVQITVEITDQGPILNFSGDTIRFKAKQNISIESPVIELHASQELRLTSEGDFHQNVKRDSFNTARIQNIIADLGNVNIKANDDVKLDGERVKLNCTD